MEVDQFQLIPSHAISWLGMTWNDLEKDLAKEWEKQLEEDLAKEWEDDWKMMAKDLAKDWLISTHAKSSSSCFSPSVKKKLAPSHSEFY